MKNDLYLLHFTAVNENIDFRWSRLVQLGPTDAQYVLAIIHDAIETVMRDRAGSAALHAGEGEQS